MGGAGKGRMGLTLVEVLAIAALLAILAAIIWPAIAAMLRS